MENVYYLDSSCDKPAAWQDEESEAEGVTAVTADEMKSKPFVVALGDAFAYDADPVDGHQVNNGFPILRWQGGTVFESMADVVASDIAELPEAAEVTVDAADAIAAVRAAYEALSEEEQAKVPVAAVVKLALCDQALSAAQDVAAQAEQDEADVRAACTAAGIDYDDNKTVAENAAAAQTAAAENAVAKALCEAAKVPYDRNKSAAENIAAANKAATDKAAADAKDAAEADAAAKEAARVAIAEDGVTVANAVYTGEELSPAVTVKAGGKTLVSGTDYDVTFANNKNAGTGVAVVIAKGAYTGVAVKTFTIAKASQKIEGKAKPSKKLAAKKGKLTKKRTIDLVKLAGLKASTPLSFAKANKKGGAKIKVAAKTGKVTCAKGLKAGTYKVKVRVMAAADMNYDAAKTRTITLTIKVK